MTEKYVSVKFSADEAKQIKSYKAIAMRNIECMPNICVGDWGEVAQLLDWICDKIEAAPDPASAEPVAYMLPFGNGTFTFEKTLPDYVEDIQLSDWLPLYTRPPAQQWIKCSERMPAISQKVDLFSNGVVQDEVYWLDQGDDGMGGGEYFWDCSNQDLNEMPLVDFEKDMWRERPQPPEVG